MGACLRVLIIDDSEDDTLMLVGQLRRAGYDVTFERVATGESLAAALDSQSMWDVVLSDYTLEAYSATDALQLIRMHGRDVPFIIVSKITGENVIVPAMKAGAHDFLSKQRLARLVPAIEREMREAGERRKRRWAETQLYESEERFYKAFHANPVALSIATWEGVYLDVNETFLDLLGHKRGEVIGRTSSELQVWISAEERARISELLKLNGSAHDVETRFRTRTGQPIEIMLSLEIIDLGGEQCVLSMIYDMTGRNRAENALRESERFARATVDALAAHLAILDETGQIIAVNRSWRDFAQANGAAPACDDYVGANYLEVCEHATGDDREEASAMAAGIRAVMNGTSKTYALEYPCHGPDEKRWFTSKVTRFPGEGPIRVVVTHQNITERRLADEETRALNHKLEQRNRELITLHEIGQSLAATLDAGEIYRLMYREIAQKLFNTLYLRVATYHPETETIRYRFAMVDGEEMPVHQFLPMPLRGGPNSDAVRTRQPVIVDLGERDNHLLGERLTSDGVERMPKSALYVPLISGNRVYGVMSIQHDLPDAFRSLDLTLITTLASQCAAALENARLYDTVRSSAAELRALYNATSFLFKADSLLNLGHQIVEAVIQEFGKVDCGLILVDKNKSRLIRLARAGEERVQTEVPLSMNSAGLVPEAARNGVTIYAPDVTMEPLYVPNDPRTRSELVVPLRTLKGVLGVLDFQSAQVDAFSESDQRILNAFAERAASALETMLLYEELNQYAGELEWRVAKRTAELHRTKERVETILNQSSDGILLIDSEMIIQQANPAFNLLFGYGVDEAFGRSLVTLVVPSQADILRSAVINLISTYETQRIEVRFRRKDRRVFDADVVLALVTHHDSHKPTVVCSLRDITARKQLEEELRAALVKEKELNELKTRFTSMVSHEFRTPLTIILTSASMLQDYAYRMTEQKKAEHLEKIQSQIGRLTYLIEDVLLINRAESGQLKFTPGPLDLGCFCRSLVDELQLTFDGDHEIVCNLEGACSDTVMDATLLRHILTNLLSNAVKYSPPLSQITLDVACENGLVTIRVQDQGIGIPEEDQKHLFEMFHRATNVGNAIGTGLGLSIVKQAVESHGGAIDFDSQVGKGTTFIVRLPGDYVAAETV